MIAPSRQEQAAKAVTPGQCGKAHPGLLSGPALQVTNQFPSTHILAVTTLQAGEIIPILQVRQVRVSNLFKVTGSHTGIET